MRKIRSPSPANRRAVAEAMAEGAPMTRTLRKGDLRTPDRDPTPEVGLDAWVTICLELPPCGKSRREGRRRHAGVLGRINRAAGGERDFIETVEQGARRHPPVGEIQRQGDARTGEGQQPARLVAAEDLEHGQERALPGMGDASHHLADGSARLVEGNDTLILKETGAAEQPVPVWHRIKRIEERLVVDRSEERRVGKEW